MKNIIRVSGIILLILSVYLIFSCKKDKPTPPVLTTTAVTAIFYTTATSGGNVTNEGGASIVSRGICWNTFADPTIVNSKTIESGELGAFTSNITQLTPNTLYYVKAYAMSIAGIGYGNQVSFTTNQIAMATLTTTAITSITQTTAVSGGNITADNGGTVTARGVCWGIATNPTTANSKTTDGSGTGIFTSSITGLIAGTTFYVRAYATNNAGTAYGNEISFSTSSAGTITVTDVDGNVYKTVTLGTQTWMAENLKTTKYRNGDLIGTTTPATGKIIDGTPYQWAYNGNESNVTTYGRLYTWYAVIDSRNICPIGWHVPTDAEWITLTDYLTNNGYGYGVFRDEIAKSMAATSGWTISSDAGTIGNDQASNNSSGFTALPSGSRDSSGPFSDIGGIAYWWSFGGGLTPISWYTDMGYQSSSVSRNWTNGNMGFSVRCVKDN